jgi:hypothetical protein
MTPTGTTSELVNFLLVVTILLYLVCNYSLVSFKDLSEIACELVNND